MPAYNCENFIGYAIKSVIEQEYKNWELIIIDDCSSDNTYLIIKEYMRKDSRIKYFKLEKNLGAAEARNYGVNKAQGEYIAFLDSDDIWFSEKLLYQINFMERNNYLFTCTSYNKIDEHGKFLNKVIKSRIKSNYDDILKTCPGNSTVIYNSKVLGKFTIEDIKKRNDYVMWLKIIKKAKYLYGLDKVLASHRIRKGSISSNKLTLVKYHWHVYRCIENLSIVKSMYLILYWIIYTIFKLR